MSGVSNFVSKPLPPRLTGHDWQRQGNPPPTNYFKSREVNFNETYEDYDQYYPEYYYDQYDYNDVYYDNGNPYEHQSYTQTPYEHPLERNPRYQNPPPTHAVEPAQPSSSQQEQGFTKSRSNIEPE